jgi:chromosome segregation ATPase
MENIANTHRNMTISTKVTALQKIELGKLAEKYKVSTSELMFNLIECNKYHYKYLGGITPKEEKLEKELAAQKRKVNRLTADLENADYKVTLQEQQVVKYQNKVDEYRYEIKETKAENSTLNEAYNDLLTQNELLETALENDSTKEDNMALLKSLKIQKKLSIAGLVSMVAFAAIGIHKKN